MDWCNPWLGDGRGVVWPAGATTGEETARASALWCRKNSRPPPTRLDIDLAKSNDAAQSRDQRSESWAGDWRTRLGQSWTLSSKTTRTASILCSLCRAIGPLPTAYNALSNLVSDGPSIWPGHPHWTLPAGRSPPTFRRIARLPARPPACRVIVVLNKLIYLPASRKPVGRLARQDVFVWSIRLYESQTMYCRCFFRYMRKSSRSTNAISCY